MLLFGSSHIIYVPGVRPYKKALTSVMRNCRHTAGRACVSEELSLDAELAVGELVSEEEGGEGGGDEEEEEEGMVQLRKTSGYAL